MRVHHYWARGESAVPERGWRIACFGGSDESEADARAVARELAEATARAVAEGRSRCEYDYASRPLREPVEDEFHDLGELCAVITRNSYGSRVLNTARVMFVDVDDRPVGLWTWLKGLLFGGDGREVADEVPPSVRETVEATPGLGLRLYRTANGCRCLITSHLYDPVADTTRNLLQRFQSDPLYIRLCRTQECFRARLTPKHWRCDVPRPPARFPWADRQAEQAMQAWVEQYTAASRNRTACRFVTHLGSRTIHPLAQRIVEIHDRHACAAGLDLA